jgi:ParB family chromosome partitioning protein
LTKPFFREPPAMPTQPPAPVLIPLDAIAVTALPRDRTGLDPEPFEELKASLRVSGLRAPVEVFPRTPDPERAPEADDAPPRYGLISGCRRLAAFRALRDEGEQGFDAIPAFIRAIAPAQAFRAMVEENEIREPLSPWERGRAAILAVEAGFFETVEAAIDALHPGAAKQKRHKLRAVARVVDEMDGLWTAPERLSQKTLLDLADALRAGFGPPIAETLRAARGAPHERQWEAVRPYLAEYLAERETPPDPPHTPGRPKRLVHLRPSLTVRRERTREGYVLRFSGSEATSPLLDEVLDEIERVYAG